MADQLPSQDDEAQAAMRRHILGDHRNDMQLQFATFGDIWAELARRCRSFAIIYETDARQPGHHEMEYRWTGSPPTIVCLTKYLADRTYMDFQLQAAGGPRAILLRPETDDHEPDGPDDTDFQDDPHGRTDG